MLHRAFDSISRQHWRRARYTVHPGESKMDRAAPLARCPAFGEDRERSRVRGLTRVVEGRLDPATTRYAGRDRSGHIAWQKIAGFRLDLDRDKDTCCGKESR